MAGETQSALRIYGTSGSDEPTYEVVGVVRGVRRNAREAPERYFYLPALQTEADLISTRYLVRTGPEAGAVFADIRAAIRGEEEVVRILSIDSADELFHRTLGSDRLIAALALGFGLLALTLAVIGVYGRLAYEVTQRRGEIGIRMALGATRSNVMSLVLRDVAAVAVAGIAAGIVAAMWLGRLAASLVFEVEPIDARVLGAAAILLTLTALCAAYFPARRAARTHPMAVLRSE